MSMSFPETLMISDGYDTANTSNDRLLVRDISPFQAAVERGDAYAWAAVTEDWASGDTLIAVENNDTKRDLHIERVVVGTKTTGLAVVHVGTGVAIAGDAAYTLNLNFGSSKTCSVTAITDETGNGAAAASFIGRVKTLGVLANYNYTWNVRGALILPADCFVAVDAVGDWAGGSATIWGWFEDAQ